MPHPFALQSLSHPDLVHQVNGALLQHAGAHSLDNVILTAILDDHRVDTGQVKKVTEHQAGRPRANDSDLRVSRRHEWSWQGLKTLPYISL